MQYFRSVLYACFLLFLVGCSTTKDKWVNRKYHETTAHYNAYFNGLEAFNDGVRTFEEKEKLNFEEILPLYNWPNEKEATVLFSKMDRALEKSAKVIKGHSMVFKGKQKNPYVVKAYLLIARSRYYKHEFIKTLEACAYIQDQFGNIEMAEEEVFWAKLLAAQTHIRMGNAFAAESLLDDSYTKKLSKTRFHEAQKAYAFYYLETERLEEAQNWVSAAFETAPTKEQKVRLAYINAQLLAELGMGYESALAYEKVLELHPNNYDITFSAQIKRAENFDVYMEDIAIIEKELRKMLRDDKNISYRDQIYYVWALKELELERFPEGESLLRRSISSSVNNDRQKGKSFLRLAGVEFDFREFVEAKELYDSALAVLPSDYPGLDTLQERVSVLSELALHYTEVKLQDSLQYLYTLGEEDLKEKFEDFIERKRKREAEAARLAEIAALNAAQNAMLSDAGPTAGSGSGKWYFYNATVRSSGLAAFKKSWGERELEDHWRQVDKPIDGFNEEGLSQSNSDTTITEDVAPLPIDDNSVEYYLARLLKSDQDLTKSLQREAVALAELGFVYKDGLNDLRAAEETWDRYLLSFSTEPSTAKVYYGKYLLHAEQEDSQEQEGAKNQLLNNFENSPYAALVRGDAVGPEIPQKEQVAYNEAFEAFVGGQPNESRLLLDDFEAAFPSSVLLSKSALLRAYLFGLEERQADVVSQLELVIKTFQGTEEAAKAAQILALLKDDKSNEENTKGFGDLKVQVVEFEELPKAPHKVVFVIPAENAKINEMRNALADFNKANFKFENLRIQNIFYDQNTQLVIVSGFRSKPKAVVYLNSFESLGANVKQFYPFNLSEVFYINNPNFGKVYRDKVLKDYVRYFKEQ